MIEEFSLDWLCDSGETGPGIHPQINKTNKI